MEPTADAGLWKRLGGIIPSLLAWADGFQRRHGLFGYVYGVIKKYGDDQGGREAALITYYGFLSLFPLLLVGVTILWRVLAGDPALRERLIKAVVPEALQSTVAQSVMTLPSGGIALAIGLIGLLFSGTGVVFSAYQTLNHVAAVPYTDRLGFVPRYVRVFAMLGVLALGALTVGALTVAATALPNVAGVQRVASVVGSIAAVFVVLVLAARLLLARPVTLRESWLAAALGGVAVTIVLTVGGPLLARFVKRAGPVYGSFATVAGMFALLYLVSQALVYSAEAAAVRRAKLWPRALVGTNPTSADRHAQKLLIREQARLPIPEPAAESGSESAPDSASDRRPDTYQA